ncbi:MAG: endo alpha-1,4 polygalactosaminidase [Polyangiaceae bacterium]
MKNRVLSTLLPFALAIAGCGDDGNTAGSGGAGANANGGSGGSASDGGSTQTGGGGAANTGGAGGETPLPSYATFHLNYTQTFDTSKCAERDFVDYDLLDTPAADIAACGAMGAKMLCYFSSQYEDWRDDAGNFGAIAEPLDGWPGEYWVDPTDPANLAVMMARLDIAVQKGCDGIDLDNIDHAGHEDYVAAIFTAARDRGLLVSQKNAIEKIDLFFDLVDLYQNEQCQEFSECDAYATVGRPVYNIEYGPCHVIPYLYSNQKDVENMDAWEAPCTP